MDEIETGPTKYRVVNNGVLITGTFSVVDEDDNVVKAVTWKVPMTTLLDDKDIDGARRQLMETKKRLASGDFELPEPPANSPHGG